LHIVATISFEQYETALAAMRKPAERKFGKTQWLRAFFITVFSFSLVIAIKTPSTQESALAGFILLVLLFSVLWLWAKLRTRSCLKQAYEAQEKQLNGQQMEISESGIVGQWADGRVSYQYKWSAFERFIDLPDAFLFLPNSASFVRIPKEFLSSEDQRDIRRWGKTGVAPSTTRHSM
jgi:YcxB-like protein